MIEKPNLVVVEDDPEIRDMLARYLERNGCRVQSADGGAALDRLIESHGWPDLIVLDLMMPGEDGLSICRRLRVRSRVAILMLTARADDIDRIVGLEMGADDYLAKPFNPRELLARIRAILRRREPPPVTTRRLVCAGIVVDLDARTAVAATGEAIDLTAAEFDLLECFLTHPGRVLSRDQLMDWTRGRRSEAFDRTIDVQISRLRRKIDPDGAELIKTIRNQGYILTAAIATAAVGEA